MKLEFWLDPALVLGSIYSSDEPVEKPARPRVPEVEPGREEPTKPARYPDKEVPIKTPDSVPLPRPTEVPPPKKNSLSFSLVSS